jgi:hypothetical protein
MRRHVLQKACPAAAAAAAAVAGLVNVSRNAHAFMAVSAVAAALRVCDKVKYGVCAAIDSARCYLQSNHLLKQTHMACMHASTTG